MARITGSVMTRKRRKEKLKEAKGYWGELHDPFAPEFEKSCRERVSQAVSWGGTNEWCVGWTCDNEQSWHYPTGACYYVQALR